VRLQTSNDLPTLPEVITIWKSGPDSRTFIRDEQRDGGTKRSPVPSYREQSFDWAENFGLEESWNTPKKGGA
jgi:hypothetical protein